MRSSIQTSDMKPTRKGINVHITILIVVTTVMSIGASLGGGLLMYFESLSSLEKTIREVSNAECDGLRREILKSVEECMSAPQKFQVFLYSPDVLSAMPVSRDEDGFLNYSAADQQSWDTLIRWYIFSSISRSDYLWAISFIGGSYNPIDPSNMYVGIWYDLKGDDSREYAFARTGKHIYPDRYAFTLISFLSRFCCEVYFCSKLKQISNDTYPVVKTTKIDEFTGEIMEELYNWSAEFYVTAPEAQNWNPPEEGSDTLNFSAWPDNYVPKGWSPGPYDKGAVMHKWRHPQPWYASDGNAYVYQSFDIVFPPPDPPHPLSSFRYIWFGGFFIYSNWEEAAVQYGNNHSDTTVVIIDAQTDIVYASSNGDAYVDQNCFTENRWQSGLGECTNKVINMSKTVQDAWREVKLNNNDDVFQIVSGHFVRRMKLFSYVPVEPIPDEVYIDSKILWLRSLSSVRSQVERALLVFIFFGVSVLIFDFLMAVLEVMLVALPLRNLSTAMEYLRRMELGETWCYTCKANKEIVGVQEVNQVCKGLAFAIRSLQEYKSFMPSTLFNKQQEEDPAQVPEEPGQPIASAVSVNPLVVSSKVGVSAAVKLNQIVARGSVVSFQILDPDIIIENQVVATLFGRILSVIQSETCTSRGIVHSLTASNIRCIQVSWGLDRRNSNAEQCAADTILAIRRQMGSKLAASSLFGQFKTGNVGSKTLRGFSASGCKLEVVLPSMLTLSAKLTNATDELIPIINKQMADSLVNRYLIKVICFLSEQNELVFELNGKADQKKSEDWMYDMDINIYIDDPFNEVLLKSGNDVAVDANLFSEAQKIIYNDVKGSPASNFVWEFGGSFIQEPRVRVSDVQE